MRDNPTIKFLLSSALVVLAVIAAISCKSPYALLVLPGMLLGFHGDLCLSNVPIVQKLYREPFIVGAISFLIGHIFYIAAFISATPQFSAGAFWGALAVYGAAALVMCILMLMRAKKNEVPRAALLVYALVIIIMAAFAFALGVTRGGVFWLAALGGLLFTVSDGFIAANDFAGIPLPHKSLLIWATYVPAQFFIILVGFFA